MPAERVVAETGAIPEDTVAGVKGAWPVRFDDPVEYCGLGDTMAMGHASPAFRSLFGTMVGIGSQRHPARRPRFESQKPVGRRFAAHDSGATAILRRQGHKARFITNAHAGIFT
jgi:hypothetical protein